MVLRKYCIKSNRNINITISIVADLHGIINKEITDYLFQNRPDVIAIIGDFVDDKNPLNNDLLFMLKKWTEIAPTYMSLGNHDYVLTDLDIKAIHEVGVRILDNEWIFYNKDIVFGGLTSAYVLKCRRYGIESNKIVCSNLEWLQQFSRLKGYKILLDHHPENYLLYTQKMDIDLILSGHTHGGQIAILGYGLYIPRQKIWPRYSGGKYDNRLVVSRGVSNPRRIPRIGNPTELVYLIIN